mmetsp:Transcript_66462/g.171875  ORF Transcript_66462/g.171875 Transcript_66462/m.171875 type:complete len:272 (+) Transcript_66462:1044-1859(+)
MLTIHKSRVRIQHENVSEVLRTEHILLDHEVFLPIEVLALVVFEALLHMFHAAISPLPPRQLRLRGLRPQDHRMPVPPRMSPVRGKNCSQPMRPHAAALAPVSSRIAQHSLDDEDAPTARRVPLVHHELIFLDQPIRTVALSDWQAFGSVRHRRRRGDVHEDLGPFGPRVVNIPDSRSRPPVFAAVRGAATAGPFGARDGEHKLHAASLGVTDEEVTIARLADAAEVYSLLTALMPFLVELAPALALSVARRAISVRGLSIITHLVCCLPL